MHQNMSDGMGDYYYSRFLFSEETSMRDECQKQLTIPNVRNLLHEKFPLQFLSPFLRYQQAALQFGSCLVQ